MLAKDPAYGFQKLAESITFKKNWKEIMHLFFWTMKALQSGGQEYKYLSRSYTLKMLERQRYW